MPRPKQFIEHPTPGRPRKCPIQPKCVHFNKRWRDASGGMGRMIPRVLDQATNIGRHLSIKSTHGMLIHHKNMGKCPYCKELIRLQRNGNRWVWKLPRHKSPSTGTECRGSERRPYGQTPRRFKYGESGDITGDREWIVVVVRISAGGWPVKRWAMLNVPGHPEFGYDPRTIKMPPRKENKLYKKDPRAWIKSFSRHLRTKAGPSSAGSGGRLKPPQSETVSSSDPGVPESDPQPPVPLDAQEEF